MGADGGEAVAAGADARASASVHARKTLRDLFDRGSFELWRARAVSEPGADTSREQPPRLAASDEWKARQEAAAEGRDKGCILGSRAGGVDEIN